MLSAVGHDPRDYGTLVGLWLNLDRVHYQRSVEIMLGILAALDDSQLGREWFDAWAHHDDQVDDLAYRTNVERLKAAVRSRYGTGGTH